MNTHPEFKQFLAELQALINKYEGTTKLSQNKFHRQVASSRLTMSIYQEQFSIIVDYVAQELQLDASLIDQSAGRCRYPRIAWARMVAMLLCRELTDASSLCIATYFNQTCHGTVNHARNSVNACCAAHPSEAALLDRLRKEVKECLALSADLKKFKRLATQPETGPRDPREVNRLEAFLLARR